MTERKPVRLNFLVRPEVKRTLDSLRDRAGADSLTEVVRRALDTCDWIATCHERGAELMIREPDRSPTKVAMPEFKTARRS